MTYNEATFTEQYPSGTTNPLAIVNSGYATRLLNTTIANDAPSNISLDATTGIVTLTGPGTFDIEGDGVQHGLTGG